MMSEFDFLCAMINAEITEKEKETSRKAEKTAKEKETSEKANLKITFIGGGEIIIPDEQWDDYRYDGKFFTVIKGGVDIAMYNAKNVYSLVLVRQGDE